MKHKRRYKVLALTILALIIVLFFKISSVKVPKYSWDKGNKTKLTAVSFSPKPVLNFHPNSPIDKSFSKKLPKALTSEQIAILCEFKKFGSSVPHLGKIQVYAAKFSPPYSGNSVWIKSPECPKDKFSILFFSDDGHISKEINCLNTSLTELMRFSGEQADVDYTTIDSRSLNLAISGGGYFVLRCPDDKLLITREGKFKKENGNHLTNQKGCTLLNENGQPMIASKIIGEKNGCSPEGDCIAIYDPGRDEIKGLEYLNSYSFTAKSGIIPSQSITKVGPKELRPSFFTNSLERLKDPIRGATGISWSEYPEVDLDELNCPN